MKKLFAGLVVALAFASPGLAQDLRNPDGSQPNEPIRGYMDQGPSGGTGAFMDPGPGPDRGYIDQGPATGGGYMDPGVSWGGGYMDPDNSSGGGYPLF